MKNKVLKLAKKIESLSASQQEAVTDYFKKHPEKVWGEQKSLLKGYSDLPLFSAAAEEKQQKLFE